MKLTFLLPFLLLTQIVTAQYYPLDTGYVVKNTSFNITSKVVDSSTMLLLSTIDEETKTVDSIDVWGLFEIDFSDFNNDGFSDIMLGYTGNNPMYNLYLYDSIRKGFVEIENYMNFPDAVPLESATEYYYSYHRAGCADYNWVSDLFKIEDFKIIHLGHIDGNGCEADENQTIDIYKLPENDESRMILIKKLEYHKYIKNFGDKWAFIEEYWNQQYGNFLD